MKFGDIIHFPKASAGYEGLQYLLLGRDAASGRDEWNVISLKEHRDEEARDLYPAGETMKIADSLLVHAEVVDPHDAGDPLVLLPHREWATTWPASGEITVGAYSGLRIDS